MSREIVGPLSLHRPGLRGVVMTASLWIALTGVGQASPNVDVDEPVYDRVAVLRALGRLPGYSGGVRPLSEARIAELLAEAGEAEGEQRGGWWWRPLGLATAELAWVEDRARPYSTDERPRDLVGALAVSCEYRGGRPCGDGTGLVSELETSAGYGRWLSATARVWAWAGSGAYDADAELGRAYVQGNWGPVAGQVGRDVLVLGPGARAQMLWSRHAPPLDHARVQTARPLDVLGSAGDVLRVSGLYAVGQLRDPQTFDDNLVSIGRVQLDWIDDIELGIAQVLQLGGEGAPELGLWDFIAEHLRRKDGTAGPSDSSNRRLSFDLSLTWPSLLGLRSYYELAFEDLRKQVGDAMAFDADHLLGFELAAIGPGLKHGVLIELQTTGVRSHEHRPRTTGLTHRGAVVGSPLGPDARSVYGQARIELEQVTLFPWLEWVRLSSDTYRFVPGEGISQGEQGPGERRYRAGMAARMHLTGHMRVEGEGFVERVQGFEFGSAGRTHGGVLAKWVWQPEWTAGVTGR